MSFYVPRAHYVRPKKAFLQNKYFVIDQSSLMNSILVQKKVHKGREAVLCENRVNFESVTFERQISSHRYTSRGPIKEYLFMRYPLWL